MMMTSVRIWVSLLVADCRLMALLVTLMTKKPTPPTSTWQNSSTSLAWRICIWWSPELQETQMLKSQTRLKTCLISEKPGRAHSLLLVSHVVLLLMCTRLQWFMRPLAVCGATAPLAKLYGRPQHHWRCCTMSQHFQSVLPYPRKLPVMISIVCQLTVVQAESALVCIHVTCSSAWKAVFLCHAHANCLLWSALCVNSLLCKQKQNLHCYVCMPLGLPL